MAIESAADRLMMLSADDFGVEATYTPVAGGGSTTVKGIFDNDFVQAEGGESMAASRAPRFHCREDDVTLNGREGDTLVINAVTYKVTVPRSDGTGNTTLWLEKQGA